MSKKKPEDNQAESGAGVKAITPGTSEQQPTQADFDKLGLTNHEITAGARLPNSADKVDGVDSEKRRGRPAMSEEERAAARERKKERDRARRTKGKAINSESVAEPGADISLEIAKANAAMIVSAFDLINNVISGNEYKSADEARAGLHGAWTAYLHSTGAALPPWVQVAVISVLYTAPAFATDTGKGKLSGLWNKAKGWWISRKGG